MGCLLQSRRFECRVSSVLNKNVKDYGKKYMFDNNVETCWNSDAGTPQWVLINFEEECDVSSFNIEFQGGFVGKNCHLDAGPDEKSLETVQSFFPEDKNCLQHFNLNKIIKARSFKFIFSESTDLFGRIIVYRLSLYS